MKLAVALVLVNGKSNVQASKQFGIPLETLRRKVLIARRGFGVEKRLGRPAVMSAEDEKQLAAVILLYWFLLSANLVPCYGSGRVL
jgi:transposase